MFDESSELSVRSFLPEGGLGHRPVGLLFRSPLTGSQLWFSHNDDLNSLNSLEGPRTWTPRVFSRIEHAAWTMAAPCRV